MKLLSFLPLGISLVYARDCGSQIGSFTAEQVTALGNQFVESIVEPQYQESAARAFFLTAKYDVKTDIWLIDSRQSVPPQYAQYCAQDGYAYNQVESSLAFLPIDPETGDIFNTTKLRAFISYADASVSISETPTVEFPGSLDSLVDSTVTAKVASDDFLSKYMPAMLAASSGSVGLLPDYFGYGESSVMNRTNYQLLSMERTTAIHYLMLRQYLESLDGCTRLDNHVTIRGVEHGAMVAVVASDTLRRFGVRTLSNFVATGPLDSETLLDDILGASRSDEAFPSSYSRILPSLTYGFSSDLPLMSNTGTNQPLISSNFTNIGHMFFAPTPATFAMVSAQLPIDVADLVDPSFRILYDEDVDDALPCTDFLFGNSNGVYRELCAALRSASVWKLIDGSERTVVFPHSMCFSAADEVYSSSHFPQRLFENPLVESFAGPRGFEELTPEGHPHDLARQLCTLPSILFYNLQGHVPDNVEDRPQYHAPLEKEDWLECGLTPPPTAAPTQLTDDEDDANNESTDGENESSDNGETTGGSEESGGGSTTTNSNNSNSGTHRLTNWVAAAAGFIAVLFL